MLEELTDTELIERVKKSGDNGAFSEIMRRYRGKAYGICFGMLHNREDALDTVQEAFIKAFYGLKGFKGDSKFSTWLYRVVTNACLDFLRKRKRKKKTYSLDDEEYDLKRGYDEKLRDKERGPTEKIVNRELGRKIMGAIDKLPKEHRAVVILREIEGLSYREIAAARKCSIGTVMSRLHYARKKLALMLKPYVSEEGGRDVREE